MQVHDTRLATALRRALTTAALALTAFGATLALPHASAHAATAHVAPAHAAGIGCAYTAATSVDERYILTLLNRHRAAAGVRPLILSYALSAVSRAHSCDMASHGWLSHNGSDGSTFVSRLTAAGVSYTSLAENIGMSGGGEAGIAAIDASMMAEPFVPGDHHFNIVNPASTRVGIGVVDAGGATWFTEDFAG